MKCITLFFSFCLIAISSIAQPNYDFSKLKRERLGRGVIAIRKNPSTVAVSWRYLSSDPMNESFDIYRNDEKINKHPLKDATFFQDTYAGTEPVLYTVKAREGKTESSYQLPANAPLGYLNIPLNRPEDGTTPSGQNYFYAPNDASIGDVDGDGEYEIILKWDPSNAHDNSHDGYTGEVYVDCYKLSGKLLWRINLGRNIRAGAHYTQFMVFDFDGDGKAEVVMKTADGTVDGRGKVIGDAQADYRNEQGRILTGPEYLTVFNGLTGEAMQTIDYVPERGDLMGWGDSRGNRSDRFLACVAYLDGIHPSVVMCRGYYTRTVLAAFDWDGKELKQRWVFDSNNPGCEDYAGQGNHNLRVGDVDGDGEYEIILKWDPSNAHDNSHDGYTGEVYVDCYKLSGKLLWRINLGRNIRAGAHYTQFMVFDFDGDGKAEVVMKTADGTVDGRGKVIGDAQADYRNEQGRILTGPEYLTVFNGLTGEAMQTIDYVPERGDLMGWGDSRGNRSDRFLACVAYLDGIHPSVVMCRGYYTRTVLAAFDWDGKELKQRWVFDSNNPGCEDYAGQGNHNLRVGDVDGDGCDEIIYGSCAIDHNGKGLYTTKMGHGDAIHLTHFDPSRKGLQVWDCHENKRDGSTYRDAATGEVIFQIKDNTDVGRCMAADIDPTQPGVEMWSVASGGIRNVKGEVVKDRVRGLSCNMAVWWDGDLLRELLDRNMVSKYNWEKGVCERIAIFEGTLSNNGTKANPCLQGDIVGDWREEVLMRTADNTALRLYVSTIPTDYRFHAFLEDPIYRISIATQNVAYNQPTQPGFYFGPELQGTVFRGCKIPKK